MGRELQRSVTRWLRRRRRGRFGSRRDDGGWFGNGCRRRALGRRRRCMGLLGGSPSALRRTPDHGRRGRARSGSPLRTPRSRGFFVAYVRLVEPRSRFGPRRRLPRLLRRLDPDPRQTDVGGRRWRLGRFQQPGQDLHRHQGHRSDRRRPPHRRPPDPDPAHPGSSPDREGFAPYLGTEPRSASMSRS
jgi:hypothetical protein